MLRSVLTSRTRNERRGVAAVGAAALVAGLLATPAVALAAPRDSVQEPSRPAATTPDRAKQASLARKPMALTKDGRLVRPQDVGKPAPGTASPRVAQSPALAAAPNAPQSYVVLRGRVTDPRAARPSAVKSFPRLGVRGNAVAMTTPAVSTGSISGTIVESGTGSLLAGVCAIAYSSSWANTYTACSNATGVYTIPGVPAGSYVVRFEDHVSGHLVQWFNGHTAESYDQDPVLVTAGVTTTDVNASLVAGGAVSGVVVNSVGDPLAGVCASLNSTTTGWIDAGGCTDATGAFRTTGVPTGDYKVHFEDTVGPYVQQWYDGALSYSAATVVPVSVGQVTPGIGATLVRGATFSGTVTDAATGLPLEGACVTVYGADDGWFGGRCADAEGHYMTPGLPAGDYLAYFYDSNSEYLSEYYDDRLPGSSPTSIAVADGLNTPDIDAALTLGGTVSGVVTDVVSDAPIPGVCVEAAGVDVGRSYGYACTDESGAYVVRGLATDRYQLYFSGTQVGYLNSPYTAGGQTQVPVQVTAGSETPGINQGLAVGGKITGTVTGGGLPLNDVCITAESSDFSASACTDATGAYAVIGLPAAGYTLRFDDYSGDGYLQEFWDGVTAQQDATPVPVVPGEVVSGKDASLVLGGRISGTISAAGGGPIPACVQVVSSSGNSYGNGCTDATGLYTVVGLPSGTYKVQAYDHWRSTEGYLSRWYGGTTDEASATAVDAGPGANATGKDIALPLGGRVSGHVSLPGGGPADACVQAANADSSNSACTDAAGDYTIVGLEAGSFTVRFEIYDGVHATQWWDNADTLAAATPVVVSFGTTATGIDADLKVGAKITGLVTDDVTGAPLQEICVELVEGGSGACTDATGHYVLGGLSPGTYHVVFQDYTGTYNPQYFQGVSSLAEATDVILSAAEVREGVDAALTRPGSISGTLAAPAGANFEVCVRAYLASDRAQEITSTCSIDAAGHYTFTLPAGQYVVGFVTGYGEPVEYYNGKYTADAADVVTVVDGVDTPGIDPTFGSLSGTVTEAGSDKALEGICVQVHPAVSAYTTYGSACTDEFGHYAVGGLPVGQYLLQFTDPNGGHIEEWYSGQASADAADLVPVSAKASTSGVDAALTLGGQITGLVTDADSGDPVPNVCVYVWSDSTGYVGSARCTDETGGYESSGLPEGDYKVQFSSYDTYLSQWYDAQEAVDTATVVHVSLGVMAVGVDAALVKAEPGTISGTVVDQGTGLPIENACVSVHSLDGANQLANGCTDASGAYLTSGVEAGSYKVYVHPPYGSAYPGQWHDGASEADTVPVVVAANAETSGVDAALTEGGTVSGTVLGDGGLPLAGVSVRVSDDTNSAYGFTDQDGTYRSSGLPAGDYTVSFQNHGGPYLPGYYHPEFGPTGEPVHVEPGVDSSGVDTTLVRGAVISGTVTDAATGSPLSGICVEAISAVSPSSGCWYDGGTTQADGSFHTPGLQTGSYLVRFTNFAGRYVEQWYSGAATEADATPVPVTLGTDVTSIDAAMVLGGQVSGTVTASGSPVADVCATLYKPDGSFAGNGGCTDPLGRYTSAAVAAGTYRVGFVDPNGAYASQFYNGKATLDAADDVIVTSGSTRTGVDASLAAVAGGDLTGTVVDGGSTPLEGAYVQVCNETLISAGCRWTATDGAGTFQVLNLRAGTYAVTASGPTGTELQAATVPATIVVGEATPVALTLLAPAPLPQGASISGPDGEPAGASGESPTLSWRDAYDVRLPGCEGGSGSLTITVTDPNTGESTVIPVPLTEDPVSPGTYLGSVPALYPAHGQSTFSWAVDCGATSSSGEATVYIDPSGTVVDQNGDPVVGATVTLLRSDSPTGPFTAPPTGDAVMSPSNRVNPMLSGLDGAYGWDVVSGYYKVTVTKASCTTATSAVLSIPPAVTGLTLTLTCTPPTAPVLSVVSAPVTATVGVPYSYTFAATGSPAPTFARTSGELPAGLTLSAAGLLSGTPTAAGVSTFQVTAANGVLPDAVTNDVVITVRSVPVLTAKSPPATASTGVPYSYTFLATGSPAPTFAVDSGALPAGLSLDGTSGVLSGTPTTAGVSTFVVRAANAAGSDVTSTLSLTVRTVPVLTAEAPPATAATGAAYSYTFVATGSPTPTFAVASGSLPAGLTLSAAGLLSGTPTAAGASTFTVAAVNAAGQDVSPSLTVTVSTVQSEPADVTAPAVSWTSSPANPTASRAATFGVAASDASGAVALSCSLDGAAASACTSPVSYASLADGVHTFSVTATDTAGNASAPLVHTWRVDGTVPTVTLKTPTLPFTLAGTTTVSWAGSDAGSGVASYTARYRRAAYNSGFGAWSTPSTWTGRTGTSLSATLAVGYDVCFQVQSVDKAGNRSAWSVIRCTARPLDDRALTASSGWTRAKSTAYYLGTFTSTKTLGATLKRTSVQLDRVGIVATRCSTCGVVGVYVGSTLVGKINLASATTQRKRLLLLPRFSLRTGTVTVKVLTKGKLVQIDGLAVSRT